MINQTDLAYDCSEAEEFEEYKLYIMECEL